MEIHCANGTALLTQDEMTIHWTDGRVEDIHPAAAASAAPGESYWGAFHEMQLRDCYAALRAGRKIPWSAQDARKTLEIVQGIYLSARIQSEVTL